MIVKTTKKHTGIFDEHLNKLHQQKIIRHQVVFGIDILTVFIIKINRV